MMRDSDASSKIEITERQLVDALEYKDDDIAYRAEGSDPGKDLVTARPITYEPYFTALDAGDTTFSLSVSNRGLERPAETRELISHYPFQLWKGRVDVPIMARNEILAEKIVAWWLFTNAKHYADIAYLGGLLIKDGLADDEETRRDIRDLVERKLEVSRTVSRKHAARVDALSEGVRQKRLEEPSEHVDPTRAFDRISYSGANPPSTEAMVALVTKSVHPTLFG